jgi:membrane-associated phospholipid phosphatase
LILRGYREPDAMLRRPGPALLLASLSAALLALTGVFARVVPLSEQGHAGPLPDLPRLTGLLDHVAHSADPGPYALVGLALALIALVRGRWRTALAIPALFVLTGATTEHLKQLVASPRVDEWLGAHAQISAASWPSGHSTAAMTMALCAVLAVPPRARPTVAVLGAGYALGVAYAILTLGWHWPSDVFGGYLVAATYVLGAIAGLAWADLRGPSRRGAEAGARPVDAVPAVAVALLAACAAAGLALARPHALLGYAHTHTTFVAGAIAIAGLAAVIATVMAVGFASSSSAWPPAATTAPRRRSPRG